MSAPATADAERLARGALGTLREHAPLVAGAVVAYLAATAYGIWLEEMGNLAAGYWPPAGIAVGVLLALPRRIWLLVLVLFTVSLVALMPLGVDPVAPATAALWSIADVVAPACTAWLLTRHGPLRLRSAHDVGRFALAAMAGAGLGAVFGTAGTVLAEPDFPATVVATTWAIGDTLGILTVTPVMLLLLGRLPRSRGRASERVIVLSAVAAVSGAVFLLPTSSGMLVGQTFLVLLPLIWSAARLGLSGASVALLAVANIASIATASGRGPFVDGPRTELAVSLQLELFLIAVTTMMLLLASRSTEREVFERLAAERRQLLAVLSHELRTPLTPIVGFTELLAEHETSLDESTRRHYQHIVHRNARHLQSLIEQLITMEGFSSAQILPRPQRVVASRLVREVVDAQELDVRLRVEDCSVCVWADEGHLAQMVAILLRNADVHGAPPVELAITRVGDQVEFAVTDAGDGVPAWFEPRLFAAFEQAVRGDRRPTLGLGLGLSICRELAVANRGDVTHDPLHRPGTRFALALPTAPPVEPSVGAPRPDALPRYADEARR